MKPNKYMSCVVYVAYLDCDVYWVTGKTPVSVELKLSIGQIRHELNLQFLRKVFNIVFIFQILEERYYLLRDVSPKMT